MPYEKDGIKYPRCTNIISDCTSKGDALTQWAANCCVDWIRENCTQPKRGFYASGYDYLVPEDELDDMRFAYKTVSDKALDVGSEVHNAIEVFLKREIARKDDGEPHWDITDPIYAKLSKQAMTAFNAFNAWQKEHNLKPIELEKTVYGSRWAGTLDFYGYFNDKLYVMDWKTSKPKNKKTGKGIYPEMRYQVAAYRNARNNEIIREWNCHQKFREWVDENEIKGCGVLRLDKETGMPDWDDTSKTYEQDLRVFNRMVDLYFERHPRVAKRFEGIIPF